MSCDCLKVHEVVAGCQGRHALDALFAVGLFGVKDLFFLLDCAHVHLSEVLGLIEELVQGIGRVNRIELLGRIFAGILEDDLLATGVLCMELN